MKKTIIFAVLGLFIILISLSYGEEPTVHQAVYYDNKEGINHYQDIVEALTHVEENGTLYVDKPITISTLGVKTLNIRKSMTIRGLNNQENKIIIKNRGIGPVFNLGNITSFKLENMNISGNDVVVVKGAADYITIKDCKFLDCIPIYTTASRLKEVLFESNEVIGGSVYIQPSIYGAEVEVRNNTFDVSDTAVYGFNLENSKVLIENNHFNGVSFNIHDGEAAAGLIQYNTFERDGRKILVKEDNQNLQFKNNWIYKNTGEVYYRGNGALSFTRNWWGDKAGPEEDIFDGNIDYGDWSLFEDFRRYAEDPYTMADLQDAYDYLELAVDKDNWIYDMDKDQYIRFLDLIAISRRIIE
ncbi:right-handed parallel beta-helix repeat-containing protein [Anaerosolibacter sp.]|uniref:right-handed parallel beta-helix repeat-containing protein n=1 Tax=Anaerosolibacter sp. TaxID=1872527 RepID=UPI0039EF3099